MGFSEYDRIRSKNRYWNAADSEIARLKLQNLTDNDIANICKAQIETNPTDTRNEIYTTVLKIVGSRSHEMVNS